jgi:glycosyltransferase involved in cell wall biosynthesis
VRIAWVAYGSLAQPTGGYVYDRLVVEGLRVAGDVVEVVSIVSGDRAGHLGPRLAGLRPEAIVGDALCMDELGPAFAHVGAAALRVLLVHHLKSWEVETREALARRQIEAETFAKSDLLIATSEVTSMRLVSDYPDAAVRVVVPGADRLPRVSREEGASGDVRLLYVGSVIPRKRLLLLADALDLLRDPRIVMRIVGDPTRDPAYEREVTARIDNSPYLRTHVARVGLVDDARLAREFARADALVLPSSLEGYGMVLTEAIRSGLPVIVARDAAIPDVVRDGGAAFVFERAEDLSGALARFTDDPRLRARMQQAADALSTSLPTWSATVTSFRLAMVAAAAARTKP